MEQETQDRLYRLVELWGDCLAHNADYGWLRHPIRDIYDNLCEWDRRRVAPDMLSIVAYRLEHRAHLDERDDSDWYGEHCHICDERMASFDDREQVRIRAASVALGM